MNVGAELVVLTLWLSSELQHNLGERKSDSNSMTNSTHTDDGNNQASVEKESLLSRSASASMNSENQV